MSSNGAICHVRTTSGGGFGKTTVTEFLFRHAGIPLSLNRATAYSATSRQPATISLKPSIPCWRSAYDIISGVMALRDPAIVVSSAPMYSIDRAMRFAYSRLVRATPQGMGAPIILWPLIATLSTPASNP